MSTSTIATTPATTNPVEHVLSEIGHGVLKTLESPVLIVEDIGKATKVLASVIADEPTLRKTLTMLVTDGIAIAAKLTGVIAERGLSLPDDEALLASIAAFFRTDFQAELVPLMSKLWGDLKVDVSAATSTATTSA